MRLGVISTPGVSYLTKALGAQAGVMISASHNPVADNGIKFFGPDGFKLSDEQELEIEDVNRFDRRSTATTSWCGTWSSDGLFRRWQKYLQYLKNTVDEDFSGIHIALDCAHGATSSLSGAFIC